MERETLAHRAFDLRVIPHFIAIGLAFAVVSGCTSSEAASSPDEQVDPREMGLEPARIVRVVDGDTFKVLLEGSEEEVRVRLVGIDTPESVASDESRNTEEGITAADYTKSLVEPGQVVWLQQDVSDTDKYDRLLRYMWLEVPTDPYDEREIATKMLNGILVINGYAQSKEYKPDTTLYDLFEEWEDQAIEEGNGVSYMWS